MKVLGIKLRLILITLLALALSACATSGSGTSANGRNMARENELFRAPYNSSNYASRLPSHISAEGEKVVIVSPRVHAWAAYGPDGNQVKGGLATAGSNWCSDLGRPCHTRPGTYRILSLGSGGCKSHIFPMPRGGAPMPYCMYFNHGQALHGSPEGEVVDGNISHGCVRMHVQDAEWLRFNFVNVGTKVVIESY